MKKNSRSQKKCYKKEPFNMYSFMNQHQKTFAGIICGVLILGLIAGLMI